MQLLALSGAILRIGGGLKTLKPIPQDVDSALITRSRIDPQASKGVEYNPPSPNRVGVQLGPPNGVT